MQGAISGSQHVQMEQMELCPYRGVPKVGLQTHSFTVMTCFMCEREFEPCLYAQYIVHGQRQEKQASKAQDCRGHILPGSHCLPYCTSELYFLPCNSLGVDKEY